MQNIFYERNISLVFDLKGSSRSRWVRPEQGLDNNASRHNSGPDAAGVAAAAAAVSATVAAAAAAAAACGNAGATVSMDAAATTAALTGQSEPGSVSILFLYLPTRQSNRAR